MDIFYFLIKIYFFIFKINCFILLFLLEYIINGIILLFFEFNNVTIKLHNIYIFFNKYQNFIFLFEL